MKIKALTMNKKKVKKILINIIIFIIAINIIIFLPITFNQLKIKKYPVARAYLMSAYTVDLIYVIPFSKIFGFENPSAKIFSYVKDTLYKTGISKLPQDEGEREIWWVNTRLFEFESIVQPFLEKVYLSGDKDHPAIVLSNSQLTSLQNWDDELYSHILTLPMAKISDPEFKKKKLISFVNLANDYLDFNYRLSMKLQFTEIDQHKNEKPINWKLLGPTPNYVKNNMNIINIFNKLETDSMKNDRESYNYFEQNKGYKDSALLTQASLNLISSERQYHPIYCEAPEVNIFATNHKKLREYLINHHHSMGFFEYADITLLIDRKVELPECTNLPAVEDYNKFVKRINVPIGSKEMYLNLIK